MKFQKGKSGNPTGARKEKLYFDALLVALKRTDQDNRTALQRIANKHVQLAEEGDMQAITSISNRLDGTPAATVDMSINDTRTLEELPDSELTAIIRGARSGNGTVETQDGADGSGSLH